MPGSEAYALPKYPSPDQDPDKAVRADIPRTVTLASALLLVNLGLSVLVTILSLIEVDTLVRLALARQHANGGARLTPAAVRAGLYVRAAVNVAIGVWYFFLISRLRRGRRWAWRRMVWISAAGSLGVVYLLTQPYTTIFKVEQVVQLAILIAIGACTLHPTTRAFIGPRQQRSRRRGRSQRT